MVTKFVMPKLGMTMEEGTIIKWLKQEGEMIKRGEELVEIETDKVTMKLEAPASGILFKILANEKEVIPVGALIALITEPNEKIDDIEAFIGTAEEKISPDIETAISKPIEVKREIGTRIFISPRARRLAREKGVDYTQIHGSGPEGRIIERDILNYLNQKAIGKIKRQTIPLEGIRKIIAKKMSLSLSEIPQLTYTSEVDMTEALKVREYFLNAYKDENLKVTMTDILAKIVVAVIKKYPIFNAVMKENTIVIQENINLGIAVATDRGLIVPVIHSAESKSLIEFSRMIRSLAQKARDGTLSLNDVSGGTFTLSNLGMFGIEVFTPIINPPESAILGVGKMIQKPIVKNGQIQIAPLMILSLTHDHRVMDGVDAANFLAEMKALLENPYQLFDLDLSKIKDKTLSTPVQVAPPKPISAKAASRFVEMLKTRGTHILGHEPHQMELIGSHNPNIIADFVRMHRDGLQEGALSSKTKALMALAIAVVEGCESCMKWHLVEALESDATDEEVAETLAVTVFMGGGPALMHSETVAAALQELRNKGV
ncbi:MAG: 2-oxo acid dehydrogenase subunit E2 [Candidatus Helarchaeota archaeon]